MPSPSLKSPSPFGSACASGLPTKTSASPMFGVVTVNRISRRSPGVTPPSCTLQNSAGSFSSRTTQCWAVACSSTTRSGSLPPPVSTRAGSLYRYASEAGSASWSWVPVVRSALTQAATSMAASVAAPATAVIRMKHLWGWGRRAGVRLTDDGPAHRCTGPPGTSLHCFERLVHLENAAARRILAPAALDRREARALRDDRALRRDRLGQE